MPCVFILVLCLGTFTGNLYMTNAVTGYKNRLCFTASEMLPFRQITNLDLTLRDRVSHITVTVI